ncbi:hopanoid biosynthesis-associated protein HpnK [Trichlorobacter ammonificans]|uniref:Hopanoid biosynthesis associated protein HpnK n=1 Tax=Trichlorobacter ammonificans TaxID=2916410 RepID=A0ABN8HKW5_9BACT|nr:hopanoid biosynthesis-associated protein HpnK [Trichlorobacter ammonificans]CAH2031928.1 Hopanoid biosynthesis associated protein HpnK [Trichlorobacter ammonificans]
MRRLVVNADDFGLSSGVNRAVETAWREGILTQASLMAGGGAFDEAVEIARRNPDLQVGLHLTLVQGRPVLPPEQIPGLLGADGCFPDNPVAVGMRLFFDCSIRKQLRAEIEAQILKIKETGLPLSHIDGHLNIQMHPTVFALLQELMPLHGITSFRITRERLLRNLAHDRSRVAGKAVERLVFGALSSNAQPNLQRLNIVCAAEVKGLLNSGRMTESYLLAILEQLNPGLTEIYFHPGCLPDEEISRRMPEYRHEDELRALVSPRVRQRLRELDITLCNYRSEEKRDA